LNQGLAGLVKPACRPDCNVREANRAVESMMFWLRLSPRFRSPGQKRVRRGCMKSPISRQ
jgi:hypothetical protein